MQPAYKVVQIQGICAYSVRSPGPGSCVCKGIGKGETHLYGFSGYRCGPEKVSYKRVALYKESLIGNA